MAMEQATQTAEQAAAAATATRIVAAGITTTAAVAAATTTTTTTQQAKERVRVTGTAEHQGDGDRRKGNTSDHRGHS